MAALSRRQVEYVLVGGGALIAQGVLGRETFDVDIVPNPDTRNLEHLGEALRDLDARVVTLWDHVRQEMHVEESPLDPQVFATNRILHLVTRAGLVDVLMSPAGAERGFEALAPEARLLPFAGQQVAAAGLPDLIRMKEAAGRPKDLEDLVGLRGSLERMAAEGQEKPRSRRPVSKKRALDARRQDEARRRSSSIDRGREQGR